MDKVYLNERELAFWMRRGAYLGSGLAFACAASLVVFESGALRWMGFGLLSSSAAVAMGIRRPKDARIFLLAGLAVALVAAMLRLLESTGTIWLPLLEGSLPVILVGLHLGARESLLSKRIVRSVSVALGALLWGALVQKGVVFLAVPPEDLDPLFGSALVALAELGIAIAIVMASEGDRWLGEFFRQPWRWWGWLLLVVGTPASAAIGMVLGIFVPETAGAPGPDFSELSLGLFFSLGALVCTGKIVEALVRRYIEVPLSPSEWASDPFFSVSSDIFCMLQPNGTVLWVNEAFVRTLGYPPEAIIGSSIRLLVHEEDRDKIPAACSTRAPIVFRMKARDGRFLSLSWRCTVSHGQLYAVATDITREREALRALELANREATEALRVKADFLANMSHEIRTPLNGVLGMAELLQGTKLDDEQTRFLSILRRSGDGLLTVVNDILDFSKIEAGKLDLDPHVFCTASVIEQAVEQTAYSAHAKRLTICSDLDPTMPTSARGDSARISQVLLNLLSNAVKFTESGSVRLFATSAAGRRPGHWRLRVRVVDTGIGIPEETRRRLFQPFSQADTSTARRFGGTGLGLSISKRLVEKMEGEIGCESEPGKGSTFWFEVELGEVPSPALGLGVEGKFRGVRVSVCVADAAIAQTLAHQLNFLGAEVLIGKSAQTRFDWVFVDEPSAISATGAQRHVLVVPFESRLASRGPAELDGSLILVRPWRFKALAHVFDPQSDAAPAPAAYSPKVVVRRKNILLAEDNPVNQLLAHEQLKKLGFSVHGVANGREAVEAVASKGYDLILMDCQMPELDGFEATRRIRQGETHRIPIIAMTAQAMPGDREKCLAAGMDDYLAKPFSLGDLAAILERWLGEKREVEVVTQTPTAFDPLVPKAIDRGVIAGLEQFNRGGKDMVGQLLGVYLQNARAALAKIRDARQRDDFTAIGRTAHSLKSSSANVGAVRLSGILIGVEEHARQIPVSLEALDSDLQRLGDEWERVAAELEELLRARPERPAA